LVDLVDGSWTISRNRQHSQHIDHCLCGRKQRTSIEQLNLPATWTVTRNRRILARNVDLAYCRFMTFYSTRPCRTGDYVLLLSNSARAGGVELHEQLQVVVSLLVLLVMFHHRLERLCKRQEAKSTMMAMDGDFYKLTLVDATYPTGNRRQVDVSGCGPILTASCVSTATPTTLLSPTRSWPIVQPSPDAPPQ
jgi:hypothetical protein